MDRERTEQTNREKDRHAVRQTAKRQTDGWKDSKIK